MKKKEYHNLSSDKLNTFTEIKINTFKLLTINRSTMGGIMVFHIKIFFYKNNFYLKIKNNNFSYAMLTYMLIIICYILKRNLVLKFRHLIYF